MAKLGQCLKGLALAVCGVAAVSVLVSLVIPYSYRQAILGYLWLVPYYASVWYYRLNTTGRLIVLLVFIPVSLKTLLDCLASFGGWFASQEYMPVPWLAAYFRWRNPAYDPAYVRRREVESENKSLRRSLARMTIQYQEIKRLWEERQLSSPWVEAATLSLKHVYTLVGSSDGSRDDGIRGLANSVAETIGKVFGDRILGASITRLSPDGCFLSIIGGQGLEPRAIKRQFRWGEGFVGSIWKSGRPEACSDVLIDARFSGEWRPRGKYQSLLGVPIVDLDGNFFGTVVIEAKEKGTFSEKSDVSYLEHSAQILVIGYTMVGDLARARLAAAHVPAVRSEHVG